MALDGDVLAVSGDPVKIYRYRDEKWLQEATLTQANSDGSKFGADVEVDGVTVFMVDIDEPHPGKRGFGAIYASTYDGIEWSMPTRLPLVPEADSDSGEPGAILVADGNVMVNGTESDVVYVYEREAEELPWTFKTRLLPPEVDDVRGSEISGFGPAVAVDGDTIVVGGTENTSGINVFVRNPTTDEWEFEATLNTFRSYSEPKETPYGTGLGNAVALEGNLLVASATGMNQPDGVVFVYERNERTRRWRRIDRLTPVGGRPWWKLEGYFLNSGFGADVKVSGTSIAVSTANVRNSGRNRRSEDTFVYVQRSGLKQWQQQLLLDDQASDEYEYFTGGVDISGNHLAVLCRLDGELGVSLFHRVSMN